jgi:predicted transcriptional regulator
MKHQGAYLPGMPNLGFMTDADPSAPRRETAAAKEQRVAREAEMIAEARASVAAGRVVSLEAVSAWIDSLGTDHELPLPQSGR